MEVILARHGQTDWNTDKIFRGRVDVALNDTGLKQADLLGDYLRNEAITAVYSSPLQRAVKTAGAIAGHHRLDVQVVDSLNDLDCGEWQGLTVPEVEAKYPELYRDWLNAPQKIRLPGGETLDELRTRALPFAAELLRQPGDGIIVLVSHRLVHKVLISGLLGLDNSYIWSFQLDTAGISRFFYRDGRAVLTAHNDRAYLAPLQMAPPADF